MNKIKELRIENNISQKQLSYLVGVAQPTVCAWENGTKFPSSEKLKRLATILNTTVDYLLFDQNIDELRERIANNIQSPRTEDDSDTEIRAIARDINELSPDNKETLKLIINSMREAGRSAKTK